MEKEKHGNKDKNKFTAFLKRVFVHNFGWKMLSLLSALAMWALAAGLW